MGMGTRARAMIGGLIASSTLALLAAPAWAQDLLGQPTNGGIDLQPAASPLKHDAIWFHNVVLMPIITGICLLVLGLLLWIVVRYNKRANPTPARWSHNTLVEVVWTVLPVLILVFISLFSFKLLFSYHDTPKVDLTIKATGNQWNWAYEYPDQGIAEYVSNMLPEAEVAQRGMPSALYRLAVDEPLVVPVGKTVRVLTTASDVIHAFALPAFGLKMDAIPGRVNEQWFRAERVGTYYGQCSELCGVDHAFMPIEIRVVSQADFDAWVVSKGGSLTPVAAPGGSVAQNVVGTTGAPTERNVSTPAAEPAAGAVPTAQTATTPAAQTNQPAAATQATAPSANAPAPAAAPAKAAQ